MEESIENTISNLINYEEEKDDGNMEYKLQLLSLNPRRVEELTTQLKYRVAEGQGECIYVIGVMDDGNPKGLDEEDLYESVENLKSIAKNLKYSVKLLSKKEVSESKWIAELLVREINKTGNFIDISVAVSGNVDSGKSTCIGVLTNGILDNGRGLARLQVFNHRHEIESGRTSSIGHQIMGFDNNGKIIEKNSSVHKLSWSDIVKRSSKVITFYDLAGHEKYLKTTVTGYSGSYPDYSMIVIGANLGFTHMTKEHISLCLSFKVPFFIVITKIDLAPENVLNETKEKIKKVLKLPGLRKIPYYVKNDDDAILCSKNIVSDNIVPIFQISNVSGKNIDTLKFFLNLLPIRKDFTKVKMDPVEFTIDTIYNITGCGTVVAGTLLRGSVQIGDTVYIGPNSVGEYRETVIRSIHFKRINVVEATAGHYVCFGLKKIPKPWVKKGMVIVSNKEDCRVIRTFKADINILQSHHTTIRKNYQPSIHINNIKQSCEIIDIQKKMKQDDTDENILRAGDKAIVTFRFMIRPVYIKKNDRLLFRENRIRGVGIITELL